MLFLIGRSAFITAFSLGEFDPFLLPRPALVVVVVRHLKGYFQKHFLNAIDDDFGNIRICK